MNWNSFMHFFYTAVDLFQNLDNSMEAESLQSFPLPKNSVLISGNLIVNK